MAKHWYVGYFYHGYLKKLIGVMETNEKLKDIKMWYPYVTEVRVKNGTKKLVKVPMFHNYVLFEFEENSLTWIDVLRQTPIIEFLKAGEKFPVPITEEEVEHIKKIEIARITEDYSHLIGKMVIIKEGHYEGFAGRCVSIIKGKFKANVIIQVYDLVEMKVEINLEDIRVI